MSGKTHAWFLSDLPDFVANSRGLSAFAKLQTASCFIQLKYTQFVTVTICSIANYQILNQFVTFIVCLYVVYFHSDIL